MASTAMKESVKAETVEKTHLAVVLKSQGIVEAERVTQLASELSGRIVEVSSKWKIGELFEKDEVLLAIDSANYETVVTQSEAAVADAKLSLANEKARAKQARLDWEKLGEEGEPSALAARKPQLASAEANVASSEAVLLKAVRDLEKTKIRVPFRGKLRKKHTDIGSVLSPGSAIAEFYSVDRFEIRLPLSLDDYSYINQQAGAKVILRTDVGIEKKEWSAVIDRVEGEVDRSSRSVYVIAVIDNKDAAMDELKPGLYLNAEIEGRQLENVIRVPRKAFLDEKRLLVVDQKNKLRFVEAMVVRSDAINHYVSDGLVGGDRVVTSAMSAPVEGMEVEVLAEEGGAKK